MHLNVVKGADVNAINKNGQSSLIYASKNGSSEIIEVLLQSGANIYLKDAFTIAKNDKVRGLLF